MSAGGVGILAPIVLTALWTGTEGSPSLGLGAVGYLLGFLVALRRWRIESPTTWHLDEELLRIERVRGSQRIPWHAVRDCSSRRAPDGTLHLRLVGQNESTAFCTLRCDATTETASAVRAVILHRSACAIADRASALRQGADAAYDDFAVAAHRLGAGARCISCNATRPLRRAHGRCVCGASGWPASWYVAPLASSVSFLSHTAAHQSQASSLVTAAIQRKFGLRQIRSLVGIAAFLSVVVALSLMSSSGPEAGSLAIGAVVIVAGLGTLTLALPLVIPPCAAAVLSGERLVIAHVGDGTSIPLGDGTQLRTRRFWTWLVIDVVGETGEPLGSVLCFGTPATTRALAARIAAQSHTPA